MKVTRGHVRPDLLPEYRMLLQEAASFQGRARAYQEMGKTELADWANQMSTTTRVMMNEMRVIVCRHECPECRQGLGTHLTCDPRCFNYDPRSHQE